jgi:signal transduction histidine kinase
VDATYRQFDDERHVNEHVVRASSEELLAANAGMRSLINALPDTYVSLGCDGTVLDCQGANDHLCGTPILSMIGKKLGDTVLGRVADKILVAARACVQTGTALSLDVELGDGAGTAFLEVRVAPTGQAGCAVVVRDVTKDHRAQSQLVQAQKLEAIGQLAAGIAHEINTPTQYIGDNLRFLRDAFQDVLEFLSKVEQAAAEGFCGDSQQRLSEACNRLDLSFLRSECPQALSQSLDGVERVAHIVYSMKDFAHPDRGEKDTVDVNRVVTAATTVCRNEWKYVAELALELAEDLPSIPAYAGDVGQVVLNLVVNAAHAIRSRHGDSRAGRIRVCTVATDDRIVVLVEDNGNGIPAAHRSRIFEQFFTTKPVGQGTGQGLALVRRLIVDRHGGNVTFDSREGVGTTFRFELPLNGKGLARSEAALQA